MKESARLKLLSAKVLFNLNKYANISQKDQSVYGIARRGCAKFVKLTADINADLLMRLRPNRCLFGAPGPYPGKGRPAKHGQKMKLSDSTTWGIPVESIEIDDPTWGRVEIKRWSQFHFYDSADHPMEIILIQRQGKGLSKKAAKPMWLAWIGEEQLSLESLWQHYLRRFAIEHWNRFVKQRLHWTKAKLGTTEGGQRWSDLMPIVTWQLWLAREIIEPIWDLEKEYNERKMSYTSSLSDREWEIIEPLLPKKKQTKPPKWSKRDILDGILYQLKNGCNWCDLPTDLPPYSTVFWHYKQWRAEGVIEEIRDVLHSKVRQQVKKKPNGQL